MKNLQITYSFPVARIIWYLWCVSLRLCPWFISYAYLVITGHSSPHHYNFNTWFFSCMSHFYNLIGWIPPLITPNYPPFGVGPWSFVSVIRRLLASLVSYLVWGCAFWTGPLWTYHISGGMKCASRLFSGRALWRYSLFILGQNHQLWLVCLSHWHGGVRPCDPSKYISGWMFLLRPQDSSGIDPGEWWMSFLRLAWGHMVLLEHCGLLSQVNVSRHDYLLVSWYHVEVPTWLDLLLCLTTFQDFFVLHSVT